MNYSQLPEFLLARISEQEASESPTGRVKLKAERRKVVFHGEKHICGPTLVDPEIDQWCPVLADMATPYRRHADFNRAWLG